LGPDEMGYPNRAMQWVVEPGRFEIRVGPSSVEGLSGEFEVTRQ
jgi:hypothetical protein